MKIQAKFFIFHQRLNIKISNIRWGDTGFPPDTVSGTIVPGLRIRMIWSDPDPAQKNKSDPDTGSENKIGS